MLLGVFLALLTALGYSIRAFMVKVVDKYGFATVTIQFIYRFISIPISLLLIILS